MTTNALAERLGVTAASASGMVKRLGELGLVTHQPYRGVCLSEAGRRVALEVIRHHRLLELYLVESLGVPWDRVHAEAEVLEHVLSDELEDLIAAKLGNPTRDPHGDPIPSRDLTIEETVTESLQALEPGAAGALRPGQRLRSGDVAVSWPTAASPRGSSSRWSTVSRSAARCSCVSAAMSIRSAASSPRRCASRSGRERRGSVREPAWRRAAAEGRGRW